MNSARPLPGSSSCPPETLPDWDSIGCVSCHFMCVSEGGLEGLLPSPRGPHRRPRAMATSGVTSTISPLTGDRRPPAFTSPEPHAGATPYFPETDRPASSGPRRRRLVAGTRWSWVSIPPPVWWRAATILNRWQRRGTSGPIRHDQRQPSQHPRRGANGRRPWARACPTLDGMGKDRHADSEGPRCSFCDKANERV